MIKKTVIVTGGAGFLGSHLCHRLLKEGTNVICIDNFYSGYLTNIQSFLNNENFTFFEKNVCEPLDYLRKFKIDEIYNFACPASPTFYQADPIHTIKTSMLGSLNFLELAREKKAKFLHASTSEIYGDPKEHPQKEEYNGNVNPIGIRACYDEGKRVAETLCFDFWRKYSTKIKVMRIFNTYGPKMSVQDGRVVSNFIVQALKGEDITIYGSGKQTRSFCYIEDLIEATISLMNSAPEIVGPFNIGNPDEFTILELADKVLKKIGSVSKLVHKELPQDDPALRCPDISKAQSLLNWSPRINLDEGLAYTIEFFSKNL